ncbi:hypothetical protein ACFVZ3_10105 [Kitasatospora purpeofusca]|uniref:hypothetical protein n=1 Tax=Kitasatospora purpeofusca TaxID=67352 RepID=UPI00368EAA01
MPAPGQRSTPTPCSPTSPSSACRSPAQHRAALAEDTVLALELTAAAGKRGRAALAAAAERYLELHRLGPGRYLADDHQ